VVKEKGHRGSVCISVKKKTDKREAEVWEEKLAALSKVPDRKQDKKMTEKKRKKKETAAGMEALRKPAI